MKKILIIGIIVLSIFLIYLTTLDKKIYYLSLGDQISLGMTKENYYEKSYTNYIKEYLEEKNLLETYINSYEEQGKRITDIINDINNNKEIEETNKTLKNSLIKSDLITISVGTNDIIAKINNINKNEINYKILNENINSIIEDLDKLLKLIREYCKEDIIMIGIHIITDDEKIQELINYANEKFKETSEKYNITYINMYEILNLEEEYKIYPTKQEYEKIGNVIIDIINNNLLK